jgi:FdhD protein
MSDRTLTPSAAAANLPTEGVVDCLGLHWAAGTLEAVRERLVLEEPLAVEIAYERAEMPVCKLLSVTMRTPGDDEDLAVGFLYCESVIDRAGDVVGGELLPENSRGEKISTWRARLAQPPRGKDVERVSRGIITSAACGLCGRTTLSGLRLAPETPAGALFPITGEEVLSLPGKLRKLQRIYPDTGGSHGAGLFGQEGQPLAVREDVGRHNAVDKVIGSALRGGIPTAGNTLVLSGRAGFELVQKAAAAGVALVVAVGAPSSLAVQLARESAITLVGFAREGRFNVYAHSGRLIRP